MTGVDARYELARLQELLGTVRALLQVEGIGGQEAEALAAEARDLAQRLHGLRAEHAARVTSCSGC
jgi:hypothetical protein